MSDQVEIVAAEDAPSDTQDGEAVESVEKTAEQPKASKGASEAKSAPAQEVEVEPLVDGPVGEVLDSGNVEARSETEATAEPKVAAVTEATTVTEVKAGRKSAASKAKAAEKSIEDAEVEPLVDGPVGEVLDTGNVEARAETEVTAEAKDAPKVISAAQNTEDAEVEPLVDGPVGEVLDTGNVEARAETEVTAEAEDATKAIGALQNTEDAEVEPLVDGPVGEVLDIGNAEARAETEVSELAEVTPEAKPEGQPTRGRSRSAQRRSEESEGSVGNVRMLSVGQQVQGAIKRIAEFGAFVDIGVGRDGLIHISELSVRRVGKVTDVLAEGQEVTAWIKKLDRDRNRISLTLIDPNTKTIRDLNKDDLVQGTVTRILPYGAFVDIGIGRDALLHVREMGVGYVAKPEDVVKVGDTIEARIIELSRRRGRVDLSLKGLRDEPEPTPAPQAEPAFSQQQPSSSRRQPDPEPEVEDADDFEDLEVLSPMELAFKRAMEAEGMEMPVSKKKQGKRNRHERNRSLQDDIIARTLTSGRK